MASLNQITCPTSTANTGVGSCNWIPSPDIYKIAIPKGTRITAANTVDFKTFIKSKLIEDDRTQRWFAIGQLTGVENSGTDVVKETAADGSVFISKDPTAVWKYEIKGSNSCIQKNFLGFDQSQNEYDFLRFQSKGFLVGQKDFNSALPNSIELGGYQPQMVYVYPMSEATWANVANSYMEFSYLNPKQDQANMAVIDCSNLNLDTVLKDYSVQNVEFQQSATVATRGVFKILALSGCGNTNLGLAYASILNDPTLFDVTDAAGTAATIGSVGINSITGEITITCTGTSAGVYRFKLASVSTLAAAGIKYYETPTALSITNI